MDHNDVLRTLGITLTSGTCILEKTEDSRLIGISIGGGAPRCPCVYIVQVFDGTLACREGSLSAGDEILSVNGESVHGKTRVEVAKMIQDAAPKVTIHYNKLHTQVKDTKSLDIVLKKVKHRMIESISSGTADALGLSRAILCNDDLIKKFEELQRTNDLYRGLIEHTQLILKRIFRLVITHRSFGFAFADIGAREPNLEASIAFTRFGEVHRKVEQYGFDLLQTVEPMIGDLTTFLTKAIPDTRLTIEKYADAKFEYLSYCLKVKEMDDEEAEYAAFHEVLSRVEFGNYEYRLVLLCRQLSRQRFARLRSDVLTKIELLEQKSLQDLYSQFYRFIGALDKYHQGCYEVMKDARIFPIDINLNLESIANATGQKLINEEQEEKEGVNEKDFYDEPEESLLEDSN